MREIVVRYKLHNPLCDFKINPNGCWIDLRSADNILTPEIGEFGMISLGISMELPKFFEAHVLPRSSTFKNFGITMVNSKGIIDDTYNGDSDIWRFPYACIRPSSHNNEICAGDRICQFRIEEKMPTNDYEAEYFKRLHEEGYFFTFKQVDRLGNDDRGGFGSSGIK